MISDDELAALAGDLESHSVERKSSMSDRDRIAETICAFANDMPGGNRPGYVFLGLRDDGTPSGLPITDQLLRDVADLRNNGNILPLPTMTVEKRQLDGVDIAVIEVSPSNDPPVRYRGRVWIRVGSTRAVASRDDERILTERRRHKHQSFDELSVGAQVEDIDWVAFRREYLPNAVSPEILEANHRSEIDQLTALHLATPDGAPNVAATLLLALDPRAYLPGAFIQFARFDGHELTDPILDQKELTGSLPDVLRRTDELAKINIRVATTVAGPSQEERHPDYPLTALQQILRNAVLHRSYEINAAVSWFWFRDRVEIHSPGGLYGRVTEANFGQPYATDYRNPILAEGLKVLGFVQHFGMGIALCRKTCRDNGNPEPKFEFSPSSILCTIESRR